MTMFRAPAALLPETVIVPEPVVLTSSLIVTVRSALRAMLPPVLATPLLRLIVRSLVPPVAVSVMWPGPVTCSLTVIDPPAIRLIAPLAPVTSSPPSAFTPPTVTEFVSATKMPPVAVAASRLATLVSRSSAVPMPVNADRATFDATMFSLPVPSKAVMSLIAPAVAVTVTVLDVVVIWPSVTLVAASSITFPLPVA